MRSISLILQANTTFSEQKNFTDFYEDFYWSFIENKRIFAKRVRDFLEVECPYSVQRTQAIDFRIALEISV